MSLLNSSSIKEFLYNPKEKDSELMNTLPQKKCIDVGSNFSESRYSNVNGKKKNNVPIINLLNL